jgi:RNA polymerase sigma factor (sigma-70 family)
MGTSFRSGLFGFIARLDQPPASDSDADLLDRFLRTADESAFAGIVRRHGLMVLAVCRRRLRRDADAEDAFQAVFLALATSARTIDRRDSLPGWLYRVAYLISWKAAVRRDRHASSALPEADLPMPEPPLLSSPEVGELRAVIDAELASLPERFRSVVVLCLIEGRTNVDAASVLGVPLGTVDSRLNAARKKLCAKLRRRGVAIGVGATLGQMLGGPLTAASGPGLQELVSITVPAVLAEAARPGDGSLSPAVAELTSGLKHMTTSKLRLMATLGIALVILGGSVAGIYHATAADPVKPAENHAGKPADAILAKAAAAPAAEKTALAAPTTKTIDVLFNQEIQIEGNVNDMSLLELLNQLSNKYAVTFVIKETAFRESQRPDVKEKKPSLAATRLRGMSFHGFLGQVLDSIDATYLIKGDGMIEIVPLAYAAKVTKSTYAKRALDDNENDLISLEEPLVTLIEKQKPLADVIEMLANRYDLSVVLAPQARESRTMPVSAHLLNLPADKAFELLAEQCDLRVIRKGNAYLITTRDHAKELRAEQLEKEREKIELEKLRGTIPKTSTLPTQKSTSKSPGAN